MTSPTKICHDCNDPKPLGEFGRTGNGRFCDACKVVHRQICTRQSRQRHPETGRAHTKRYVQKYPEKARTATQRWRANNLTYTQMYNAAYYADHAEDLRARGRLYHYDHLEEKAAMLAAWLKANPQKRRLYSMRRYARKAGLPSTMTEGQVAFLFQYWNFTCALCGKEDGLFNTKLILDHWIPLCLPECPGTIVTNMIVLCHGQHGCNNSKGGSPPERWLRERFGPRKAAVILKKITAYFALVAAPSEADAS